MALGWSCVGRRWGLLGLLALALGLLAGCQPPQLPGGVPAQSCVSQRSGSLGASGGLVVALAAFDPTSADHTSALYGVRASDGAVAWSCASSTYAGWDDAQLVNGVVYALAGTEPTKDFPARTHAHGLYAIRPHDGHQLWSYSFQAGSTSALAFDGGLAYFSATTTDGSASHSNLYAIHTSNGALAWSESFGNIAGQPIIVGHRLIVPIHASNNAQGSQPAQELRALSVSDGSTLWSVTLPGGDELQSWLSLGDTFYYTDGSSLSALDAATGKTRWTQPGVSNMSSPLFSADGAILFSASQSVFAFDQTSGAMRWSAVLNDRPQLLAASSALAYATTQDTDGVAKRLYALDISTGDVRWQQDAPFAASPTAASDATYFTISVGPQKLANVVAVNSHGALRWTYQGQSPYAGGPLIPQGDVVYYVWQTDAPVITTVTCLRASDGVALWTTPLAAQNTMPLAPLLVVPRAGGAAGLGAGGAGPQSRPG